MGYVFRGEYGEESLARKEKVDFFSPDPDVSFKELRRDSDPKAKGKIGMDSTRANWFARC